MTIEKALEELDTLIIPRDGEQDRLADAFDMAVEALELMDMLTNRPCGVCKHHEHGLCTSWDCPFDKVVNNG